MSWIQWTLSFIGVLGLIFLLFYAMKKLNKGIITKSGNKLKILDRVNLGREGMLLIVSVSGRLMLIGATSTAVSKLCDIDISEDEYIEEQEPVDFKTAFMSVFSKTAQPKVEQTDKTDGFENQPNKEETNIDERAFKKGETTE